MSTGWDRTEEFFQLVQLHKPQTTPTTEGASGSRSHQLPTASRRYGAVDFLESSFETPSVEETQFSKDSAALGHELSQASRKIIELQKR